MIDTRLINKAKETSRVISTIDSSWRTFVEDLKQNIFTLPFKGNYCFLTEDNTVLVESYCGTLVIDKLYYNHKTYLLKKAISHEPFRIYGVYDSRGRFSCFVARPEIGVHFLGMNNHGHSICTGEIQYTPPTSLNSLKEIAKRIIQSFRIINMESLGTVLLPKEHEQMADIIAKRDKNMSKRVDKLLTQGLIEPIL